MRILRRFLLALVITVGLASGAIIEVSTQEFATVEPGDSIVVEFSVFPFLFNHSLYPTSMTFSVHGLASQTSNRADLPGTSGYYYADFLFEAYLESKDGTVSVPIRSNQAWRLGHPTGTLIGTNGWAASVQTVAISGRVTMSTETSEAIFGPSVDVLLGSWNATARVRLVNTGAEAFVFGTGDILVMRFHPCVMVSDGGGCGGWPRRVYVETVD